MVTQRSIQLLPQELLVKTGDVDHADWNYRPLLGQIQRLRFRLIDRMLDGVNVGHLLEVGYGSGVFMPHLAHHCRELSGVDIHGHPQEVIGALQKAGVRAKLFTSSVTHMPMIESGSIGAVVIVSAIEYVEDIEQACLELKRVMSSDAVLCLVTPGHSPVVDFGLKLLTGEGARENYGDRRARLLPTLKRHFSVELEVHWPWVGGRLVRLYTALRLRQRS